MTSLVDSATGGGPAGLSRYECVDAAGVAPVAVPIVGRPIIRGVEVVQTIQDLRNSVPLIADKATVVRIYLGPGSLDAPTRVTGEIGWRRAGVGEAFEPATSAVSLDPEHIPPLGQQRTDIGLSLNFRLPPEALGHGPLELRLTRLFGPDGSSVPFEEAASVKVELVPAQPLRIRVIGLRYRVANSHGGVAPAAVHFAYLRSFLQRTYPTAEVIWSHTVVDADFQSPFSGTTVDRANAQVAAIRAREVSGGMDPRTHYYGLVDDNGGTSFMRGKAFAIPQKAQPDVVACGPCGVPNGFAGDHDLSYADWYGAHELGHTFGRFHPGFPPFDPETRTGQDASDETWPYPEGRITTDEEGAVGLDVGDQALGIPMTALSGENHHDIMTYRENQWISAYTYKAILSRLDDEEVLAPRTA